MEDRMLLLTCREAAALLRVTEGAIYKRLARGAQTEPRPLKIGGRIYFRRADLEALLGPLGGAQ